MAPFLRLEIRDLPDLRDLNLRDLNLGDLATAIAAEAAARSVCVAIG